MGWEGKGREKWVRFDGCSVVSVVFLLFFFFSVNGPVIPLCGVWALGRSYLAVQFLSL